jgi:hypothetical protein
MHNEIIADLVNMSITMIHEAKGALMVSNSFVENTSSSKNTQSQCVDCAAAKNASKNITTGPANIHVNLTADILTQLILFRSFAIDSEGICPPLQ